MSHRFRARLSLASLLLFTACAGDGDVQVGVDASTFLAPPQPSAATVQPPLTQAALARLVVPQSVDADGRPRLVRASGLIPAPPGLSTEAAARRFVDALGPIWDRPAPADLTVRGLHRLRSGASIVTFDQTVEGVPVWGGRLSVLTGVDDRLLAVGGTRAPRAIARKLGTRIDAATATARAVADRFPADADLGPSQAKRVLLLEDDVLRPVWMIEVYGAAAGSTDTHLWRVFLDESSGDVVGRESLTVDAAFTYRVFADADAAGRPFDGPQQSFLPHPTGRPDGSQPAFVAPNLVTMDGFNTNPAGTFDSWLPAGATTTNGNNVDAYADRAAPDGLSGTDFRASTTSAGVFDRTYAVAQEPLVSQAQGMAAVTHLFYVNNWLHDWWYDSGFTEAAGNAQQNNFGRGGAGGDPLHAEAQDDASGGSRNNANMSTPSDGMSPRMQMFLWTGASQHTVTVTPGGATFPTGTAAFGPQTFDVNAQAVLASDAAHEACGAIASATGRVVVVIRGNCNFSVKAQNVQNAGGIGMIVVNNAIGVEGMAGTGATLPPTLMISTADGATLQSAIAAGTTSVRMVRTAAGVERDGDLDTGIVAHEWGHYLHHRLAACGGSQQCAAMSEGWGDFVALMTLLRATDDPHGIYPTGVYAAVSFNDAYFGIRRAPYSTDLTKNGFTFGHIQQSATLPSTFPIAFGGNNEEVHNAGEVWAAMMWQAYVALIDKDGYATARRQFGDMVVASLLLSPTNATFTEARDALLAAAQAIDPSDTMTLAQAFAVRGAGSCAVAPARTSTTLDGVVEDFALRGKLGVGAITLDDSVVSCDTDGILDAGETGSLSVTIVNGGMAALTTTTVTVSTTTPGVTIVAPSRTAASVPALGSSVERFTVRLDPTVTGRTPVAISVRLDDAGACSPSATGTATITTNFDVATAASANDDVEADATVWTVAGSSGVWARELLGTSMGWHGLDVGSVADAQLTSPPLTVGASNFVVGFSHRFDFEWSTGTFWDGGVIELSTDGGTTWADASTLGVTPGYTGTLSTMAGNPLGGRQAYGRRNAAYPNRNTVSLNFGTRFAGQTVRLRFRIGTDQAEGAAGWEIDDLTFAGITNTPFPVILAEGAPCMAQPVDAGVDAPTPVDAGIDAPRPSDAGIDAPTPVDAANDAPTPVDATEIDAPAPDVDAATPEIDAATPTIDAGTPGGDSDGGCCSTGDASAPGSIALGLLALALVGRPRRRRLRR